MAEKVPPNSSNMYQVFCRITTHANQLSKTRCLSIFVFPIAFLFVDIEQFFNNICFFGSNGIKQIFLITIAKKISIFFNFALIFYNKELKPSKKTNKLSCFLYTILMTRITLLFIVYFVKTIDKFWKNSPVLPLLPKKDFFGGVGLECESESIAQGRSYVDKNISIYGCFFSRSSQYSGDGGVIYISGESYSMNANHSMFYNCVCSGQGGAIYFYSANSYLRMVCANSCSASSYDHFAYLVASQVNRVEYQSVSYCSPTTSGIYSIHLSTGDDSAKLHYG